MQDLLMCHSPDEKSIIIIHPRHTHVWRGIRKEAQHQANPSLCLINVDHARSCSEACQCVAVKGGGAGGRAGGFGHGQVVIIIS